MLWLATAHAILILKTIPNNGQEKLDCRRYPDEILVEIPGHVRCYGRTWTPKMEKKKKSNKTNEQS